MDFKSKLKTRMNFYGISYSEVESESKELEDFYSATDLTQFYTFEHGTISFDKETIEFNNFLFDKKQTILQNLLNQLEMTDETLRTYAARSILFIAQGCPVSLNDLTEENYQRSNNIRLLLELGIFPMLIQQLNIEINSNKYFENFESSTDIFNMDLILNIIYLIIEQIRIKENTLNTEWNEELNNILAKELNCEDKDNLLFTLFDMMVSFSVKKTPKYPIKKILLLIWKLIYVYFGNLDFLAKEKCRIRLEAGLSIEHYKNEKSLMLQKVYPKNFESFINKFSWKCSRMNIDNPIMINDSIKSLKKYLYTPLSELQKANKIRSNEKIDSFYGNLLPKMSIYVYSLVHIFILNNDLLNNKTSNDSMNILQKQSTNKLHSKSTIKYLEAINKAITGLILLLLKHFKLNHIYQFEYFSQILVNCGALEHFTAYIETNSKHFLKLSKSLKKHESVLNIPITFSSTCLFTNVNILRIIIKLIKWKNERIFLFMDHVSQSLFCHSFLSNEALSVYCLKILKIISKMIGKKWKQDNIVVMNEIYKKVRRHLIEDLSFWENEDDELSLSEHLDIYNKKFNRCCNEDTEFKEYVKNLKKPEIPEDFHKFWEQWVTFNVMEPFNWDLLLSKKC